MSDEDRTSPVLRASDADREETATALREHCAVGRLTHEELSDRLDAAYSARTVAELKALLHDLPELPPSPAPRPPRRTSDRAQRRVLHAVGTAVLINVAFLLLFLASGAHGGYWPRWIVALTLIRLAFVAWRELGPAARTDDEPRLGRGGAERLHDRVYRAERGALPRDRDGEGARDRPDRR